MWGIRESRADNFFFDQTLAIIDAGGAEVGIPLVAGYLYSAFSEQDRWNGTKAALRSHLLHVRLRSDPYVARGLLKPRGYSGDAKLIDMIYDRVPPPGTSQQAQKLFHSALSFQGCEAVRQRRIAAERFVFDAHRRQSRVCVLACGHFREADGLAGQDLRNFTLVDQDARSLEGVRARHGDKVTLVCDNVFKYLRKAVAAGEKFDLIYTLGLTDYLDTRAMKLLHRQMRQALAEGGTIRLANFVPGHLAIGWMEAVMDWHLIYRDEAELAGFAHEAGLTAKTWMDPTGAVAWCEMGF